MVSRVRLVLAVGLLFLSAPRAWAQEAVTIRGRVFAGGAALQGASVRISDLDLGAVSDVDGRYSFIVPSSRVRGQAVTLTARYPRYRPESVRITLVGGALVQDFVLQSSAGAPAPIPLLRTERPPVDQRVAVPAREATPSPTGVTTTSAPAVSMTEPTLWGPRVDSTAFMDIAGSTDLSSALAGRMAGMEVRSASVPGGSSVVTVRGIRTLVGTSQPLYVVNGIPLDDATITTAAQIGGRGGFDHGDPISDLNLEDIASVQLLRGPAAAAQYGGRAANGVVLVTTRRASGLNGFTVSASQQYTRESPLLLPSYQNAYGQGLGGIFSFFDGKGGGVNDSVSQSWGPALDGRPIAQASYTEASRPDVRVWVPQPDNVRAFFQTGRTFATNVAALGSNGLGHFRLSLSNRDATGLVPRNSLTRRAVILTVGAQPAARLEVSGDLQFYSDKASGRPGTGVDESNPVSVFSIMGRQVDVEALRGRLRDAANRQISWHYAGHNNPFFATDVNENRDERTRFVGGGALTYGVTSWLMANARLGVDRRGDARHFTVAPGWMGGFPFYAGRGNFSTGGFQDEEIDVTRSNAELSLRATPSSTSSGTRFAFSAGAGRHASALDGTVTASDAATATPTTRGQQSETRSNVLRGGVEVMVRDVASLGLSARRESATLFANSTSEVYPALLASVDLARAGVSLPGVGALRLRAGWSRSGNEVSPALLRRLQVTDSSSTADRALLSAPELTSGWEVGTEVRTLGGRAGVDLTYYHERSENLLFPLSTSALASSGAVANSGIEFQADVVPLRLARGVEWRVSARYARNTSLVESLAAATSAVPLGLAFGDVSVEARAGAPLGTLVGLGYLRNAAGAMLLRNGRPLPDTVAGARILGGTAPNWMLGLESGIKAGAFELSALFDVRRGGRVFSATNRIGAVAGTLQETAFRPDTGLLIEGIDVATGIANAVHVSVEQYYRSLAAIGERWVYDASFVKLREARASVSIPLRSVGAVRTQRLRASVIGRNLALWSSLPNVDPESVLSSYSARGAEMGQLPTSRSIGLQISITP